MDAKTIGQKIKEVTKSYQNIDDEVLGQKYLEKLGLTDSNNNESQGNPIQQAVQSQNIQNYNGLSGLDLEKAITSLGDPITQGPGGSYSHNNYNAWDYGVPPNTPLKAESDITAEYVPDQGVFGNRVLITMPNGKKFYISHLTSGTSGSYKAGQVYGYSGSTGKGSGPHIEIAPQ